MKKNDLEYYDLHADSWWQEGETLNLSNHLNQSRFQYFANYVSNWEDIQVLDIGCGGGLACEFLAKQKAHVSGIDLSLNSIKVAQEHARNNQLQIDYCQGVAEKIPFTANTFDVVLCCDVLEHINNLEQTIFEAYRVLKPGGLFLFDTINRTIKSKVIMIWLLEDILKQIPRGFHDWNKFIKPTELTGIMQEAGFEDIIIQGFDMTGNTSFDTLVNIISHGLSNKKSIDNSAVFNIEINQDTSVWYIGKAVKY